MSCTFYYYLFNLLSMKYLVSLYFFIGFIKTQSIDTDLCKVPINWNCPHPDITYFLYTRQNQHEGEQVWISYSNNTNLYETNFNPSYQTKVLIHGYNSDVLFPVLVEVKRQYFLRDNYNIFFINWSSLAKGPCYPAAVFNTRLVGKCSVQLVNKLHDDGVRVHLIGFSLGAHVAGIVGRNAQQKISRITGLDPAMPGFVTVDKDYKLDATDANFVDVIHTNAFLQGIMEESGHVDFYVNGGIVQPGCWAERRYLACNHHRSALYFAESINTRVGLYGWPCSSYLQYFLGDCLPREPQILMGEYTSRERRGSHLVITNSVSPFAVGRYLGPIIEIYY